MILPNKHLPGAESLLATGALVLKLMAKPMTISTLWERAKAVPEVAAFDRFVLTLDLLFLMGAVVLEDGLLRRANS